jgi:hypothetical protein
MSIEDEKINFALVEVKHQIETLMQQNAKIKLMLEEEVNI